MGVNQLSDWTDEEIDRLSGAREPAVPNNDTSSPTKRQSPRSFPTASLDLSINLGPIRNQGSCISCWAFSAIATIEYAYWKKTGMLLDLSEQQLVDCAYGSVDGCQGGWMNTAFNYIASKGGIILESNYPYTATNGRCNTSLPISVRLQSPTSYATVSQDYNAIKNALANVGPTTACVDTNSWGYYASGIFTLPRYATTSPTCTHAVVLVGYGTYNGIPYWKVRNNWGSGWGENGYMRMDARRYSNGNSYSGMLYGQLWYPILQ